MTVDVDLMQSLASLQSMLDDLSKGDIVNKVVEDETVEDDAYCIHNGAYVRIADDGMSAWIYLNPPKEDEDFYSRADIVTFIKQHNVTKGFHESNISAVAKKHVYQREVLIAKGLEPTPGNDGYYDFFFDTSNKKEPLIREDGTADYSAMSQLTNVLKGDLLAEYHHAVPPINGYDVYGNDILIKPSRELPPLRGRGITNKEVAEKYYADANGRVEFDGGRIDIKETYEVLGDIDNVIGKVEFFGDIHITGSVGAGVIVRASRNVVIDGVVEAAQIFAGGNVVIGKGIKGGQKGTVAARGDVCADFIEFSTVHAGGIVRSNAIINSAVFAGNKVIAEGKKGVIIGGLVRGLLGVEAITAGNEVEVKTQIGAGYSDEDYQKYLDVIAKEKKIENEIREVAERLSQLIRDRKLGREINSDAVDKELVELTAKKDEFFEKMDKIKLEKEETESVLAKGTGSSIVINDKIFRGVKILIEGSSLNITQNTCFMKYRKEDGRIAASVIVI